MRKLLVSLSLAAILCVGLANSASADPVCVGSFYSGQNPGYGPTVAQLAQQPEALGVPSLGAAIGQYASTNCGQPR